MQPDTSSTAASGDINPVVAYTLLKRFPADGFFIPPANNLLVAEARATSTEARWMELVGGGDREAFASLYDRFSIPLFSFAYRILNNISDAEDVIQEVFLKVWTKAANFDENAGTAFTWLVCMTRNKAIDRLRSRQSAAKVFAESTDYVVVAEPASANVPLLYSEEAAMIHQAMAALPEEQRRAIALAFFGGLTHSEIAEKLEMPPGTIKARIRRGMLKLREVLEDHD